MIVRIVGDVLVVTCQENHHEDDRALATFADIVEPETVVHVQLGQAKLAELPSCFGGVVLRGSMGQGSLEVKPDGVLDAAAIVYLLERANTFNMTLVCAGVYKGLSFLFFRFPF